MTETSSAHTDHCFCTSNTAGQRACCQCPALYETPHVTGPLPEVAMSAREAALRAAGADEVFTDLTSLGAKLG